MNTAGKLGAGFLLGALLAGAISMSWGYSDPAPLEMSTTTVASAVEIEPWLEEGEVRFSTSVILPRGLIVENGTAVFDFELAGLSPSLLRRDGEYQGDSMAYPEHWVVTTASGATIEASTGLRDTSIWLNLPTPEDQVATIRLVGWREGVALGRRIELPIEVGASGSFRSGAVTIENVLRQTASTIVQLEVDEIADHWQFTTIRPLNGAWRVSGRGIGGRQLIWDGDDAPDVLVLEDVGVEMRAVSGDILVVDQREES